jgi:hypothetical protein
MLFKDLLSLFHIKVDWRNFVIYDYASVKVLVQKHLALLFDLPIFPYLIVNLIRSISNDKILPHLNMCRMRRYVLP